MQLSSVRKVAVVQHTKPEVLGDAVERLYESARAAGVEIVADELAAPDLVVALGGDGTMLRALRATLGRSIPVFGVNFGRVGFLTSVEGGELELGLARAFAGDYRVVELATLTADLDDESHVALNDIVVTSSLPGRMVELGWEIGGEDLGDQPCDGMICSTPTGSTAYNLSNGGPVMMWGLQAMAITFVAPHSLHARPIVVPVGLDLRITNRSRELAVTVLVDGHSLGELVPGEGLRIGLGRNVALLALLPEVTFFSRYRDVFV